jgi:hypothetical protein
MARDKPPVIPGITRADLEVFDRPPPSIVLKRVTRILRKLTAVIGLVAYLWVTLLLVSEHEKEQGPLPDACKFPGALWETCRAAALGFSPIASPPRSALNWYDQQTASCGPHSGAQ